MSEFKEPNISVPKRKSRPPGDSSPPGDSRPPEKRARFLPSDISKWEAFGADNILDKLHLERHYITVSDNDLTSFISDTPGFFQFQGIESKDQKDLDEYFETLDRWMDFEVADAAVDVHDVIHQYGGYDLSFDMKKEEDKSGEVDEIFSTLHRCTVDLEQTAKRMMRSEATHLVQYYFYAMDFIGEVARILMSPTECQQWAFVDLFRAFSRLTGLQLEDAARDAVRRVHIFGETVSGKPDMRAYVPINNENWWSQNPVTRNPRDMPLKHTISAVVQVELSAPSVCTRHSGQVTEEFLGPLVGAMLTELLSITKPVVASRRTHMLGILVLSTEVFFIKLHIPRTLLDAYRNLEDRGGKKGTVYVTQGFDFLKRKTRLQVLKILHKIGTIKPK